VHDAGRRDQLVGWVALHVEMDARMCDLSRERPDVDFGQHTDDIRILEVNWNWAELSERGNLLENYR